MVITEWSVLSTTLVVAEFDSVKSTDLSMFCAGNSSSQYGQFKIFNRVLLDMIK